MFNMEENCTTCKHCGVKFDRATAKFKRYCKIEDLFEFKLPQPERGKWHTWKCHWHNANIGSLRRMFRNLLAS